MKMLAVAAMALALAVGARPARAQEPTPGQQAAARALIAATHDSANFYRAFYRGMFQTLRQRATPVDSAALMPVVSRWVEKYLAWRDLEPEYVRLYASVYTEQQMRDIAAFYRSPTGRRVAEVTPELVVRSTEIPQRLMMPHMAELVAAAAALVDPPPPIEGKKP